MARHLSGSSADGVHETSWHSLSCSLFSRVYRLTVLVELRLNRLLKRFAVRAMAGTLCPEDDARTRAATGFHRNVPKPFRHAYRRPFHQRALGRVASAEIVGIARTLEIMSDWMDADEGPGSTSLLNRLHGAANRFTQLAVRGTIRGGDLRIFVSAAVFLSAVIQQERDEYRSRWSQTVTA
jgi:hypothetical protein